MKSSAHTAVLIRRRGNSSRALAAIALLAAVLNWPPGTAAQPPALYKCTTASGTPIYSDRACAPQDKSSAGKRDGETAEEVVEQEVPNSAAAGTGLPSPASIARRCAVLTGTPMSMDAALRDLPERQREAFKGTRARRRYRSADGDDEGAAWR